MPDFPDYLSRLLSGFGAFFSEFLWPSISGWWQLPWPERVGKLAGAITATYAGYEAFKWLTEFLFKTKARMKKEIEGLEARIMNQNIKIGRLTDDIKATSANLEAARYFVPEVVIQQASRELRDGNDEIAASHLEAFYERVKPGMLKIMRDLSEHHIRYAITTPLPRLNQAKHFIKLALLFNPNDEGSRAIQRDIAYLRARLQEDELTDVANHDAGDKFMRAFGIDFSWSPESSIAFLKNVGVSMMRAGYPRTGLIYLDRARRLAEIKLSKRDLQRLLVICWAAVAERYVYGELRSRQPFDTAWAAIGEIVGRTYHEFMVLSYERVLFFYEYGELQRAIEAIEPLIQQWVEAGGERDENTLINRGMRASILRSLGRNQEALDAIDVVLPLMREVKGAEHPTTLTSLDLRAVILMSLGRNHEALDAIDECLLLERKVNGAEHPHTLSCLRHRASILEGLGHNEAALDVVDAILPLERWVKGVEHPDTLSCIRIRASILKWLGRTEEALHTIEELLPAMLNVRGAEHPDTLSCIQLRAAILIDSDRNQEALEAIDALLPLECKISGEAHGRTLALRLLRAACLISLRRLADAEGELLAILPNLANAPGAQTRDIATLHYRMARIAFSGAISEEARFHIQKALALFASTTTLHHPLYASAMTLADLIENKPNDGPMVA